MSVWMPGLRGEVKTSFMATGFAVAGQRLEAEGSTVGVPFAVTELFAPSVISRRAGL